MAVNMAVETKLLLNVKKAGGSGTASGRAHLKDFALVPGESLGKKVERTEPLFLNSDVTKHFVREGILYVHKKGKDTVLNADMRQFFEEILGKGGVTAGPNKEDEVRGQLDRSIIWVPGAKEMRGVGIGHYYFFTNGVLGIFINEEKETAHAYWVGTPGNETPFHTFRDVHIADGIIEPYKGSLYAASPNSLIVISKDAAYSYEIRSDKVPFFTNPHFEPKAGGTVEVHDYFDSMSRHVFNILGQGEKIVTANKKPGASFSKA